MEEVSTIRKLNIRLHTDRTYSQLFKLLFLFLGEPIRKSTEAEPRGQTDYDKLVELFYTRLAEQRQFNQVSQNLHYS